MLPGVRCRAKAVAIGVVAAIAIARRPRNLGIGDTLDVALSMMMAPVHIRPRVISKAMAVAAMQVCPTRVMTPAIAGDDGTLHRGSAVRIVVDRIGVRAAGITVMMMTIMMMTMARPS